MNDNLEDNYEDDGEKEVVVATKKKGRPKKNESSELLPFSVEVDHPGNCDIIIQSIPGLRLRGAIDPQRPVYDAKTGDPMIPRGRAEALSSFPKTPGMQLHINPETCEYSVTDPLEKDEVVRKRISKWLANHTGTVSDGISGVAPMHGKLDVHRMKTLCREVVFMVNANEMKRVKGVLPTMEEIENMEGKFMLNPGSRVRNTQPVFEEDFDDWVAEIGKSGG